MEIDEDTEFNQVVLHEDKNYYPTAEEVYGKDTETLVKEEDTQPLEVPIIAPIISKKFESQTKTPLSTSWTNEFMAVLMSNPELVRNVAVVGHLHHGKTTLMDMMIENTHDLQQERPRSDQGLRFTDTRFDEQARGISIKMMPMSLVMQGLSGKSYLLNLLDTPGHVNFNDEVTAAMRLADGILLVVDAVEGMMVVTERLIKQALSEGLPICLFISKVDRLITELKLPPADAYHKLRHTIEEINGLLSSLGVDSENLLDPCQGNVAFGSCISGWTFTLESFAKLYTEIYASPMDSKEFARRLWGDFYYYKEHRMFKKTPAPDHTKRSFVEFVLEPLYKLYSQILGEHPKSIEAILSEFNVQLKPSSYNKDVKPLLKEAFTKIFGHPTGLVDMLTQFIPSSKKASKAKIEAHYTGNQSSSMAESMRNCDRTGALVVHIAKLFPRQDCTKFDAFGRIFSGTIRSGDQVRVLGESYTPEDEEDSVQAQIGQIWVYQSRYRVPFSKFSAGNLVLIEGIDSTILKTATVVTEQLQEELWIFRPLKFDTISIVKIATEPLKPAELPKMVEGLRKINKSYPLATTKVEESGEHTILGTGEIYLDSLMKDLRELYADIEVKVADPVVSFNETVVETSSLKCFAETPNRKNKITLIAEPMEKGLSHDIESSAVNIGWSKKRLGEFFQDKYDWDLLASRSIWAFGPDRQGPNILMDDSLSGDTNKGLLAAVKESIIQGFQWGAREGPLCEEPIRNVKFKIIDAEVSEEPLQRGGGQIIPTARRCMYSAFLMATPRLMEPVYYVEIQTPADCMSAIYNVLAKRRGHVTADVPKPGTPIFLVKAFLPVIESFGFETDLRYHTQGQAFCLSVFDHWNIVPGDPLDRNFILRPLEPAPVPALAREFLVKTRRRKGMNDDVSITKYFDDPMLLELAKQDLDMSHVL